MDISFGCAYCNGVSELEDFCFRKTAWMNREMVFFFICESCKKKSVISIERTELDGINFSGWQINIETHDAYRERQEVIKHEAQKYLAQKKEENHASNRN